jgi:hypothetical protein
MSFQKGIQFKSFLEFWEYLPKEERIVVDVLRQIILKHLPSWCKEKLSYNVPYYYGKRRICLLWPGAIPWGGIREGVLFGFCYGNRLKDPDRYLTHGTNKQVFYRIFRSADEIDYTAIVALLKEAVEVDSQFK